MSSTLYDAQKLYEWREHHSHHDVASPAFPWDKSGGSGYDAGPERMIACVGASERPALASRAPALMAPWDPMVFAARIGAVPLQRGTIRMGKKYDTFRKSYGKRRCQVLMF
ncbi:hypothetical protein BC834DRAFT_132165 [Gloeopeniophorella convolvens]|nr:hypothetical protein BC834DRAFT_132165 [Gloeopeniophorella convolvens]